MAVRLAAVLLPQSYVIHQVRFAFASASASPFAQLPAKVGFRHLFGLALLSTDR
jgi:hypothetical protein